MNQSIHNTALDTDNERFPIRVLAEKTRVGTSTIRAWERRYGLLHPARTPKGHRLYNYQDVQRVLKVLDLLKDGHSLPAIAEILSVSHPGDRNQEPIAVSTSAVNNQTFTEMNSVWQSLIQQTLASVNDFSIDRIDTIFNEASSLYPIDMVIDRLILPTLELLGDAWQTQPESGIAEEHFYSSWLRNRLGARFHHSYTQARGTRIVCACAPGSYHEIGLMLFSLSALARGYRVLYFGADLPLNQLPYIIKRSAARAVVLSVQGTRDQSINPGLIELTSNLSTPVFIGGSDLPVDIDAFEKAGGILLGSNISVALRVFESHVAAYPSSRN